MCWESLGKQGPVLCGLQVACCGWFRKQWDQTQTPQRLWGPLRTAEGNRQDLVLMQS